MRKKIRGLIAMVILLICFSVPAAAATESFHFEQKTASVQVGKTKELSVYNNGRKVDPKESPVEKQQSQTCSHIQWKSHRKRAGEMFRFMLFMEEKKFPVKCIHIISSYTQILPDIKQLR